MMGIVWITSNDAKVFRLSDVRMERSFVIPGPEPSPEAYFEEVSRRIANAQRVLLLGPDSVKDRFAAYLMKADPTLARRIVACDAATVPGDAQIALLARKYFKIP